MLYKNITEVNANTIKILIEKSANEHAKIKNLYERYRQTEAGVPILTRKYVIDGVEQKDKINNKLANDFLGEIVDMKVDFFCGVPISYVLDKTKYQQEKSAVNKVVSKVKSMLGQEPKTEVVTSPKYETDLEKINEFNKTNAIADLDVETTKRMTICGYCGRLAYINVDYQRVMRSGYEDVVSERVRLAEPWELIFIGDSIERPDYTIRYYETVTFDAKGEEKKTYHAELYTKTDIQYFIRNDNKEYVPDPDKKTVPHFFKMVPLWGYSNNDEMLGDANKVLSLIDNYDTALSDVSSEMTQWRLAYLAFLGCSIDANTIKAAMQTGAFSLPEGADAKFLTKDLNDAAIEHHMDRIERNIYRFSKTPNMNDVSFSGNLTGVAMRHKFRPFEGKCKVAENKYTKANDVQFEMLANVWNTKGGTIDPANITYVYTRNYPQNLVEEIQMLRDSKGIVSEKTRFGLVSFIVDPEREIEMLKDEETENLDMFIARNEMMSQTKDEEEEKLDVDQNAVSNEARGSE